MIFVMMRSNFSSNFKLSNFFYFSPKYHVMTMFIPPDTYKLLHQLSIAQLQFSCHHCSSLNTTATFKTKGKVRPIKKLAYICANVCKSWWVLGCHRWYASWLWCIHMCIDGYPKAKGGNDVRCDMVMEKCCNEAWTIDYSMQMVWQKFPHADHA